LKKLDKLAASVSDWKKFNPHDVFKDHIHQSHGRKHSFWSKYEVKKVEIKTSNFKCPQKRDIPCAILGDIISAIFFLAST